MAELKASEVKYSEAVKTKLGGVLLTITQIEFPASAETVTGGVELNLEKLGLADNAVLGNNLVAGPEGAALENATTTQLPIAAWTPGYAVEAKTAAESAKEIKALIPVIISINANKLFLRFGVVKSVAEANLVPFTEGTTANKAKNLVGGLTTTIFVLGK